MANAINMSFRVDKNLKKQADELFKNCRKCHIEPDWLLVYKKDNSNFILFLIETGLRSDLFI